MTTPLGRCVNSTFLKFFRQSVKQIQAIYFTKKVLGYASLGVAIAKCEEKIDSQGLRLESLTREQCIKQACLLSVNSATTLLTTTSSALLDICREYKESLNRILFLLEELQNIEGENPQLWDAIVEARGNVNKAKAALTELNCYMESVEKVVNSTTEAAFLAGAEYICTALCERLYSAQKEISEHIMELKKLEDDYVKIQKEIVSTKDKNNKGKSKTVQTIEVSANNKQILQQ